VPHTVPYLMNFRKYFIKIWCVSSWHRFCSFFNVISMT